MALIKKAIEELQMNPFTMIGKEWFLLTAGTPEKYNTMTCSWGAMGEIWNAPTMTAYVRTSRYTFDFMEEQDMFTISIFPEKYRKALAFCGSHSGREVDKIQETGLTPITLDGAAAFEEAKRVFVCQKVYAQMMNPESFMKQEMLDNFYGKDTMHKMYLGKITAVYENEA